jgi:4-hydroxyphenylpyruvate dioxygenase
VGLDLLGVDGFDFVVADLPRSRSFYVERMDFREAARATPTRVEASGHATSVFEAGDIRVAVSTPLRSASSAGRHLRHHPAGVTALTFRVADLHAAWSFLNERGATIVAEPVEAKVEGGRYRAFEIATPLGSVLFRFVERPDGWPYPPEFERLGGAGVANRFDFQTIDHITSNTVTMMPVVLWYREVLGFEKYWDIEFHTAEMAREGPRGSGLRSIVMWDRLSRIKLATNEPLRPFFHDSQINVFVDQNHGAGVQHIALRVPRIVPVVHELRARGIEFLETPDAYYEMLPGRLAALSLSMLESAIPELRRLRILVDGKAGRHLLQIFLREASALYGDEKAGPFFFEIIQREGHEGFGEGNFRALFEAIEREQFLDHVSPMG